MPWFEERSLFVGSTQIRWYEPGVGEGRIDVNPKSNWCLMPLETGRDSIVHCNCLIRQHGEDVIHFESTVNTRSLKIIVTFFFYYTRGI